MKSLVVAQDFPWPPSIGSHLRLAQVVDVLSALGDTDLFALVPTRRNEPCVVPDDVHLARVTTVSRPRPVASAARRLAWLASPGKPLEVVEERDPTLRRAFLAWAAPHYDFVWFSKAATFELLGRPGLGPSVVDLDDLEDRKIAGRLAAQRADASGHGARLALRQAAAGAQARLNARRWSTLQRSVAGAVGHVALCSALDAERSGLANVVVVPNGYDQPAQPAGRVDVGSPPVVLLAGSFCYPPNADAARWLVARVLPLLQMARPEVTLRLVGEPDDSVARLHQPPAVTVVGRIPAMGPELERADLVAVPLRSGSGTRVKVLEAFAHRIPVVSTTLGAEGLGAEDGRHLLVADDPEGFAAACVRLLDDVDLRRHLVDAAEALFVERFRWSAARERIRAVALETTGGRAS